MALTDSNGTEFKIPNGGSIAAVLANKSSSGSGSLNVDSVSVLIEKDGNVNSYTFLLDGQQQGLEKTLSSSEIDKINVKEALDLLSTGTIGAKVTTEIFNPSSTGGYSSHDSQTRYIYDSADGVIISKNALTVGSDLSNSSSFTTIPADDINGPEFTLINNTELDLTTGEAVVGVRRTIKGNSNTGFELIIGKTNESQKRILKVDNDGTPLTTDSNSTINPTDIHYKLLELSTGIDLNGDGRNGFSIAQSDIANQNAYNELNRRVSLTDDNEIILSRELLPTGSLNKDNLTPSFLRFDNWNGPGVVVLTDSNGNTPFIKESSQTILEQE